jgi:hypothetical protein
MQASSSILVQRLAVALSFCILFPLQCGVAQVVELRAEIETTIWPFKDAAGELAENLTSRTRNLRCLVGTNSWLIETDQENSKHTWWFTGTNMIWHVVVTGYPSKDKELYERNHPEQVGMIGRRSTRVFESVDGNPGRPARTMDLLGMPSARICWLAFCSGSCLKREGRQIFPPSDLWKELVIAPSGFTDKTIVFEDEFGLPSSVDLYTTNRQPVLQYRLLQSTNVLGRDFPLVFHLAQYRPAGTNGWELHLTAKGRVTSISKTNLTLA